MDSYEKWNVATAELPWGVQRVLKDTLEAVKDGQVTLVYGADYSGKHACLINSVAQMLSTGGGYGIPMQHFGPLVGMFDVINAELRVKGVNTDNTVSPMAAEVLLRYFAPLKEQPIEEQVNEAVQMEAFANHWQQDESFSDATRDWLNSLQVEDGIVKDFAQSES